MKKVCFLFLIITSTKFVIAQEMAIGQWKGYLSYRNGISVAQGNGKAYCLTTGGVIVFNTSDNSMEQLSRLNGLSDVEPTTLNFNSYNNKLLIAYKNSNIDIIESNNTIVNMVDLKMQPMRGSKTVNDIYCLNQYAYLSCAFGIVVIDMDKYNVKDTYIIGPLGSTLNVRSLTSDANYFYAATDSGVYKASVNSPDLANYAEWSLMPGLPKGIYNSIASFNGKVYTNFSKYLSNGAKKQDTTYFYNGTWNYFGSTHNVVYSLSSSSKNLAITYDSAITIYDANQTLINNYTSYFGKFAQPKRSIFDSDNNLWIADYNFGLVSKKNGAAFEYRYPNGPGGPFVNEMSLVDEQLWVVPGKPDSTLYANGLYHFSNNEWNNINGNFSSVLNFDTIYNINHILINPTNVDNVFASSINGLIDLNKGVPTTLYNKKNSPLRSPNASSSDTISIAGIAMDASGNLWVANSKVATAISIKKTDGTWQSVNFSSFLGNAPSLGKILIDKNNQLWVIVKGMGLLVYNGNGAAPTTSNTKILTTTSGNGALPDTSIYCLTEDVDGKIWVGTQKGPTVFNNPGNIFNGQNFDSQQIYVQQNGSTQLLLLTEQIPSIKIDGANRKWIATQHSGVFLMSDDGTQEISHFNSTNSSLFSNNVKDIAINQKTGVVYFATDKGIISYRGTATEGNDDFIDVYAFPNPVKPEYSGVIAIKGLINNTTVKITDINGAVVYETQSLGGQAVWDGKNYKGERISTGVYMVFCTNEDGSKKLATKILFIN